MANNFQPNLAAKLKKGQTYDEVFAKYADKISQGVMTTPKIDGIRVAIHPELGPVSRTLQPVPNSAIRKALLDFPELRGFDTELTYGEVESTEYSFQKTFSAFSGDTAEHRAMAPDMFLHVFDDFSDMSAPYYYRVSSYMDRLSSIFRELVKQQTGITVVPVPASHATSVRELYDHEQSYLDTHYEGLMFRHRNSLYKCGRSTWKEMGLCALKRFEDAEARIIGFEELMHNENELQVDERGYAKRSSAQEGLVPGNMLGKLIVEGINGDFTGLTFKVGSGFNRQQRIEIWSARGAHLGRILTFKYQPVGIKELPRAPIFKSFRVDI